MLINLNSQVIFVFHNSILPSLCGKVVVLFSKGQYIVFALVHMLHQLSFSYFCIGNLSNESNQMRNITKNEKKVICEV